MLKIRLRRMGAIRQPHYRIVVADARAPRDGHFIEILGHYNPRTEPATIQVDVAKYEEWKGKGAQPTDAVARLIRQFNRTVRKAEAVEAVAPAADLRTRTASGKRVTPATTVSTAGAASAVGEAAPTAAPAPAVPDEEGTDEPVLEAANETPMGAEEGASETDTAS